MLTTDASKFLLLCLQNRLSRRHGFQPCRRTRTEYRLPNGEDHSRYVHEQHTCRRIHHRLRKLVMEEQHAPGRDR